MPKENPLSSNRFRIGVILIIINFPVGWIIGPIVATWLGMHFDSTRLGLLIAAIFYLLSWVMLGLGSILAGKQGLETAKRYRRRRKTLVERLHRWEEIRATRLTEEALKLSKKVSSDVRKIWQQVQKRGRHVKYFQRYNQRRSLKTHPFRFRFRRKKNLSHDKKNK